MDYRGRFAPTPSGPLHLGSLFAAVASYLDARSHGGQWLLRIEDSDPLRTRPEALTVIPRQLAAHGLHWDGDVVLQSERDCLYEKVLKELSNQHRIYECPCSRQQLKAQANHSDYCGRNGGKPSTERPLALRFRAENLLCQWQDRLKGSVAMALRSPKDDVVLRRKEGFYSYHLAVVTDDIAQGITHVVRGHDLLDSTPVQLNLYTTLGVTAPSFGHFDLLTDEQGKKLSKSTGAATINEQRATENLRRIMVLLDYPLIELAGLKTPEQILQYALQNWTLERANLKSTQVTGV